MKPFNYLAVLFCSVAALPRPAAAAELKILEPADRTLVRGELRFRIKPELAPGERVVDTPEVTIQDDEGNGLITLRAHPDTATGICAATFDSKRLPDGYYQVMIHYKSLVGGALKEVDEILTLGVRNGTAKPARFLVELEDKPYGPKDTCTVTVKVVTAAGKPMPGARVSFQAPGAVLDVNAAITDSDGEVNIVLDAETAAAIMLTITVEKLAPVQRVVRFID